MLPDFLDLGRARQRGRQIIRQAARDQFRAPPDLTVSEWADLNRMLPETSAEPGRWRTDRAPYLRAIMDACSDPEVERVAVIKAAQVGYSELLMNVLGFFIDQDPAPILLVQISTGEAAKFSKERVAPLIEACPVLRGKVKPARSRDSDNTIESKGFPGGHLGIVGANAPSGLRSRARRVVLFDEVDGYPPSAGSEGDPVELARKRQSTFWNRLEVIGSTPTIADLSRIEEAVRESHELRRYHVPYPHCGEMQPLEWGGKDAGHGIKWDVDEHGQATEVVYVCRACSGMIEERHKPRMLAEANRMELAGDQVWFPELEDDEEPHPNPTRIAFHITGLLSPWVSWAELVQEWLDAQGHPGKLQVFINTRLGEVWDAQGATVDAGGLMARREAYGREPVPEDVVLITAGVDVQADRLEVEFVGWGVGEESWGIDYLRIPGDPTTDAVWKELERNVVDATFEHPSGNRLVVAAVAVDSGYQTQQVYKFVKDRQFDRVWAVKGMDGEGKPIMGRPSNRNKMRVPLYPVGVDTAKAVLYGRLRIDEPGPGYMHFPERFPYDEEYFRQLTAEKMVLKQSPNGHHKRVWVRRHGRKAEVLDIRVYATAALEGLIAAGFRLDMERERLLGQPEDKAPVERAAAGSAWVDRGRGSWI